MRTLALMCAFGTLLAGGIANAERRTKVVDRVDASAVVLDEVMATPDKAVPAEILHDAKCVAIVPSFVKGAFIVGVDYGKGVAACRTATGWSAPAPIRASGGNIGLEMGGQKSDLVLFVMNDKGMNDLLSGALKIGGDMSVAAGPVGRHMGGAFGAENPAIFSYSRTKGLFAGLALGGTMLKQDRTATVSLYGRDLPARDILSGNIAAPSGVEHFMQSIKQYAGAPSRAER